MTSGKRLFEILFESSPHPTWVYDVETLGFLEVNRAAIVNYGFAREEFLEMHVGDLHPKEDGKHFLGEAKQERLTQGQHRCKDGRLIPVRVTSHIAHLGDRKIAVMVAEDVRERKDAKEHPARSDGHGERAARPKDQFLSTMSHELRTPLNAVLGFAELIADERYGALNDRQRRYADNIYKSGKHLLRLINDIMDLSKIESGRLELALENVRVCDVFTEAMNVMRPLAEKKSQKLTRQIAERMCVRADAARLKQVLVNLIGNAVESTPSAGRIHSEAWLENGRVRIEVRDSGPGIDADERKHIFEPFYCTRASGEPREGTGLGLTITQHLVELHGSQLRVDSEGGNGSCFHFFLPAATETLRRSEPEGEIARRSKENPRVLVIEEDAAAAQLISFYLASAGYEAVFCQTARHALEEAVDLQPDAITLNLFMKPTNGWELLMKLKGDKRTTAIPVIVVTMADQAGMGAILDADECLVKPVESATLVAAVDRCLGERSGAESSQTILVVEDDELAREVITEMLQTRGYEVEAVADGAQARARVATSLPAMVILDLLLPKVSGFDLIAEWRGDARTAGLPVFVLTSKELSDDETKYLRANAEFLVHKQHDWQESLLKQLQRAIPEFRLEVA